LAKLLTTLLLLVYLLLLTYLLLLPSHNNPTTSAVAADTAVVYVIADVCFPRGQANGTVSVVAGVPTVVKHPPSTDVSIVLASLQCCWRPLLFQWSLARLSGLLLMRFYRCCFVPRVPVTARVSAIAAFLAYAICVSNGPALLQGLLKMKLSSGKLQF
jgi:hypothetical protein